MVLNDNYVQKIFLQVIYAVGYKNFILYFAYDWSHSQAFSLQTALMINYSGL